MVDDKFIESFIEIAEQVAPGQNIYVYTFSFPGKYVKTFPGISAKLGSRTLCDVFSKISSSDRVFVHWFSDPLLPYIQTLPQQTQLYLFLWGGDFLEQTEEFFHFNYGKATKKLIKQREASLKYDKPWPLNWIKPVIDLLTNNYGRRKLYKKMFLARKQFLKRLNYLCHWNLEDTLRISKAYGEEVQHLDFFYDLGLRHIQPLFNEQKTGRNVIWLGNSATPTNNHLEVLNCLKIFKDEKWELYAPLSYGQTWYADYIASKGKELFGIQFKPLMDFIPLNQYLELLNNIDVVIMNHHRSQAGANIFCMVYMGKKVFLSLNSTIYSLLVSKGIKIFPTESIENITFDELIQRLSVREQRENSERLYNLFSEDKRRELLSKILN
ncbi:MAG: TDP-N-acetylfucosamine:lipid II N-acetylfucosaminyltransferase [Ferruginibacter sp.]|nr:TDP-N-acetylfucosamine:lipid II N-acetylfucosaminyltransferase [Ferruginibacter sp.]